MLNFHNKLKKGTFVLIIAVVTVTTIICIYFYNNFLAQTKNELILSENVSELSSISNNENIDNLANIEQPKLNENVNESSKLGNNKNTKVSDTEKPNLVSQNSEATRTTDYTKLYPDLYCQRPAQQITPEKTIFLTFDDGPSDRTLEILDILRQKEVKATFFVTGSSPKKGKEIMKRIVEEGHAIGVHTYTHEFRQIYSSVEAYLEDFNKIYNLVYETTGIKPSIFRYPGGSNTNFNKNIRKELLAEMNRRGFDYYDWNLSSGDAVSRTNTPVQNCINNVLNYSKKCNHGVVLMHDAQAKHTTVKALSNIIDGLIAQGFKLDKLSNEIDPKPYSLVKTTR